ncbi:MAG: hypothetical protein CR974_00410 [Gammaproteobacteria bacterium]|nr:MAG: hypothetical protein CR974_00410 [Gammaproteobacteria bacterium]
MQQPVSLLDTLVYLFDYLVYEKATPPSVDELHAKLGEAGFPKADVERAMTWLLDLNDLQESNVLQTPSHQAVRQFTPAEAGKIAEDGRDCLRELVRLGVIDTRLREIIIHKLMTLEEIDITADEIKWIALMAVYNREGKEASAIWLEQSLLEEADIPVVH